MQRIDIRMWLNQFEARLWALSAGITFTIAVLLSIVSSATPPAFAGCTSTSQCPGNTVCQGQGNLRMCLKLSCNDNMDCPSERPLCAGGLCQAPPNTGTGPGASPPGSGGSGSSNTLGNVGEPCGPYKIGQVMKSKACKPNLICHKGTCQMPAQ